MLTGTSTASRRVQHRVALIPLDFIAESLFAHLHQEFHSRIRIVHGPARQLSPSAEHDSLMLEPTFVAVAIHIHSLRQIPLPSE